MRAEGTYSLYISVVLGLEKKSKLKIKNNVIKNNFRILIKQYAYRQTILKAPVKFEKDWPKTVGGVAGRRYILPIQFCSIRTRKKSKLKMKKKNVIKNNFRILKKQYASLQTILKAPVKFEKDWPKPVGGVAGRRMVGALTDGRTLKISEGLT